METLLHDVFAHRQGQLYYMLKQFPKTFLFGDNKQFWQNKNKNANLVHYGKNQTDGKVVPWLHL